MHRRGRAAQQSAIMSVMMQVSTTTRMPLINGTFLQLSTTPNPRARDRAYTFIWQLHKHQLRELCRAEKLAQRGVTADLKQRVFWAASERIGEQDDENLPPWSTALPGLKEWLDQNANNERIHWLSAPQRGQMPVDLVIRSSRPGRIRAPAGCFSSRTVVDSGESGDEESPSHNRTASPVQPGASGVAAPPTADFPSTPVELGSSSPAVSTRPAIGDPLADGALARVCTRGPGPGADRDVVVAPAADCSSDVDVVNRPAVGTPIQHSNEFAQAPRERHFVENPAQLMKQGTSIGQHAPSANYRLGRILGKRVRAIESDQARKLMFHNHKSAMLDGIITAAGVLKDLKDQCSVEAAHYRQQQLVIIAKCIETIESVALHYG